MTGGTSAMAKTMLGQPAELARMLSDRESVERAAGRVKGHRVLLVGTGTSWHAANIGAYWLRLAGLEAWPLQAADAALYGPQPQRNDAVIVISHRGNKAYGSQVFATARQGGVVTVQISRRGNPDADIETVDGEISSAHTASYTGSLFRLAQLASQLGAGLGRLDDVPEAIAAALSGPGPQVRPPERMLQFIGAGPNQWTAAEGALKVRETSYVAAEGLGYEQFLHGPSVALTERDALICLDGGGPAVVRLEEIRRAAAANNVRVHHLCERSLGEALSVFPLTVLVQRIALDCARALGTDPDSFGLDLPGHQETWGKITL